MTVTPAPGRVDIDRHLLLAFDGHELPGWFRDVLRDGAPAGVTLFASENVAAAGQVRELTDALQRARPEGTPPLLVAADQEGGQLLGLGRDTTPFAGNLALGAAGDPDLAERVGAAMGTELRALGVTVDYAPVCDLAIAGDNPAVGLRSFGDDPSAAATLAAALVRGLRSAGVAATAKHFPGKGAVAVDTHHELGRVDAPRDVLDARELAPFRAAIAAGAELVMTGHFAVPAVTGRDDLPATLAPDVVAGLLREELGFDGVVVTDALDMKALAQGAGRLVDAVAALRAGVDLLLCTVQPDVNRQLVDGLRLAAHRGLLAGVDLAASVARVDRLRRHLAGVPQPDLDMVGCAAHRELAAELAQRATTLLRDDAGLLPLRPPPDGEVLVLQPRPRDLTPADTTSTLPPTLADDLRRHLPGITSIVYDDPPASGDVRAVAERAGAVDLVVLATSAASVVPEQRALAEAVFAAGTPTVVVTLRTPHDAVALPQASTVVCAYGAQPPSTAAVADVLAGVAVPEGRLPVDLGADLPRGHCLLV